MLFRSHDTWVDNHFSGTTANETGMSGTTFTKSGFTFTSGNTLPIGSVITGAFVEYDHVNMKERIISEAYHKLTMPKTIFDHDQDDLVGYYNLSTGNTLGIFYQPHYRVKLRQLSPYIETSTTNNIYDLPDNAEFYEKTKLWRWRDVYDHGFIDDDGNGTDFPFFNGQHYVLNNFNFYLITESIFKNKKDGIKDINPNC